MKDVCTYGKESKWRLKDTLASSHFAILIQYYWANHTTKHELSKGHAESTGKMRNVYITRTLKNRQNYERISIDGRILEQSVWQQDIPHLRQQCHTSKSVIFQEKRLKVLKYYNYLWVQWRHNCSPAASFADCVIPQYLLKVHMQTFLSIPITKKCQILSCDTLVANERYDEQTGFVWFNARSNGGALQTVKTFRVYKFRGILEWATTVLRKESSASSGRSLRQNCTLPELYTTLWNTQMCALPYLDSHYF
jgi:hypothetical protein